MLHHRFPTRTISHEGQNYILWILPYAPGEGLWTGHVAESIPDNTGMNEYTVYPNIVGDSEEQALDDLQRAFLYSQQGNDVLTIGVKIGPYE